MARLNFSKEVNRSSHNYWVANDNSKVGCVCCQLTDDSAVDCCSSSVLSSPGTDGQQNARAAM